MSVLAFLDESLGRAEPSTLAPAQSMVTPDPALPSTMRRLVTTRPGDGEVAVDDGLLAPQVPEPGALEGRILEAFA